MEISRTELNLVLARFNPWWRDGDKFIDLPLWRRAVFNELWQWVVEPPAPRAVLLSGARQVGKTTLLRQVIQDLLKNGVPTSNIIYVTFDHPLIKLAGIDAVLTAWREKEVIKDSPEYLFIDEAQFIPNWGTWIKHQVDFNKQQRITFTGSALPLIESDLESSVGRTHTIRLATLSFYEYLQLKESVRLKQYEKVKTFNKSFEDLNWLERIVIPKELPVALAELPKINSLEELFNWTSQQFLKTSETAVSYVAHFHEYLVRGGFPQTTIVESITQAQTLLREDIVDKVLKRDMTALFGVRRIQELEQTFLYLCMHDSGQLNMERLSSNLGVKNQTAKSFIKLLEATHLIYQLPKFGDGKEVLRGRNKIYMADAAISPAVFLKGKGFLEDSIAFGKAIETTAFKHLYVYYCNTARLSYWLGQNKHEVDVIAEQAENYIPFEIKQEAKTDIRHFKGLLEFCKEKNVKQAYIVTKSLSEFGLQEQSIAPNTQIMKIPAPLFCYWLGALELKEK
jgi:predicted AAA+ superfamily ATPase